VNEKAAKRTKQPNARMCYVCGVENKLGLHASFYYEEDDNGVERVVVRYEPCPEHEGYPGVMHGGIITALLDETMGRVAIGKGRWVVTGAISVRFHKPTPTDQVFTVVGEPVGWTRRKFEAKGEIRLEDGTVTASATGIFIEIPQEEIPNIQEELGFWQVIPD
jgi:uncharacterized protein (TIGR00369 family)